MMNTMLKTGSIGLAGLVTAGLVAWQAPALAKDADPALKRDDDSQVVVTTVDDDDDDDTGMRDNTDTRTRGDNTRSKTNTRTRGTDLDNSRGDRTRDWTRDGGDRTIDHSRHHTNDRSRNNTRG
jgi:hypothetical protein